MRSPLSLQLIERRWASYVSSSAHIPPIPNGRTTFRICADSWGPPRRPIRGATDPRHRRAGRSGTRHRRVDRRPARRRGRSDPAITTAGSLVGVELADQHHRARRETIVEGVVTRVEILGRVDGSVAVLARDQQHPSQAREDQCDPARGEQAEPVLLGGEIVRVGEQAREKQDSTTRRPWLMISTWSTVSPERVPLDPSLPAFSSSTVRNTSFARESERLTARPRVRRWSRPDPRVRPR